MPLNTNIALGVQIPQFESPMKMALVANQLRESQMKAQEYEAAAEERNRLRALNPADPDYANQLMRVSPTQGIAYQKSLSEKQSAEATRTKTLAEAAAVRERMTNQALRDISSRPSDANITAHLEDVLESNLYTAQEKAAVQKRSDMLLQMPFEARKSFLASQGASASELAPKLSVGPTGIVQTPAFGGKATIVEGTAPAFQMTPAQIAQNKIAQQQLAVSQGQLSVAQQRLANEGQGVTYQQDAQGNIVALPSRLSAGGAPVARPVTGEGGVAIKGKPSAFAEKAAALQKQQAKDISLAITEIEDAIKPGGLLEKSTASGAGKLADMGAAFFGSATPGAIAAASLKPIADLGLKMIPRFEGPQSDKDTASYKEAAGQLANEALPVETRKAAAQTMVRIMKARKGQFVNEAMATEGIAPHIAPPAGFTSD